MNVNQEKYNTLRKMEALSNPDHFYNSENEDIIEACRMFMGADFIEPKEMKFLDFSIIQQKRTGKTTLSL